MNDMLKRAVEIMKFKRVDFGDIRIIDEQQQNINVKNTEITELKNDTTLGFGVRVLYSGGWGFASSNKMTLPEVERVVELAIDIAKASSNLVNSKVRLSKEESYTDVWKTPCLIDPFSVSVEKKLETLFSINNILLKNPKIKTANSKMSFIKTHKYYASTENSFIEQVLIYSGAGYNAVAIGDDVQVRSYPGAHAFMLSMGYEYVDSLKLVENAERVREEAIALLTAPLCPSDDRDLIIYGDQLALQIHESCGHASELDRVLGYEESYAGSSFLTTDKLGKFRYGSDIVNLVADTTLPGGLATCGYDDDGVKAQRWHIVKNGILSGYMTNREFCNRIGDKKSMGANRADSYHSIPIIRITNLGLMPGEWEYDDIIKSTKKGVILENNRSWSIDQKRLNFQFGCEIGWLIENGKIKKMVKNPVYQGITHKFWGSCDAIANEKYWKLYGVSNCGKGQPGQIFKMTHASSPARFKNVKIFGR
ncbi:MAG: TldD/PmbA family protein [Elusimicrobiales bacterium]|nr:TldD/PmbA family protein [Elusimicrobiales bacterium]